MPIVFVVIGILLLFLLIAKFKLNAFLSFIIVSLFVGISQNMDLEGLVKSIQTGIGNTLGFLVLILGLGAMLGKLVADSGAAQQITTKLVEAFGVKYVQWAVVLTGFIVGIPNIDSLGIYHCYCHWPSLVICWFTYAYLFIRNSWIPASSSGTNSYRRYV